MKDKFAFLQLNEDIITGEYDCGDNSDMVVLKEYTTVGFNLLVNHIVSLGYKIKDKTEIDGNIHFTLISDKFIHAYYTPRNSEVHLIIDDEVYDYTAVTTKSSDCITSLFQFEVDHSLIDCGMCYIIRCDDGSFFVIDSAHFYSINDDRRIIEFLKRISGEEKPCVSGWFLSHAHEDHIAVFNSILEYHANELEIESVYYNFPSSCHRDAPWEIPFFNMMAKTRLLLSQRKDIKQIKLHTGMRFAVRNLLFTVLCTHEDVFPNPTNDFNNTSTVISMQTEGSVVMFPGDASAYSDKVLTDRYYNFLKSDIIQISHHGHSGLSPEFYRRVNAPCALFPVTVIKYDEEWPRQESNRIAVELSEEYYIASNGTVQIDLPYKRNSATEFPDETFEDFDGIYNLWSYEYTQERKAELYNEFLRRSKK